MHSPPPLRWLGRCFGLRCSHPRAHDLRQQQRQRQHGGACKGPWQRDEEQAISEQRLRISDSAGPRDAEGGSSEAKAAPCCAMAAVSDVEGEESARAVNSIGTSHPHGEPFVLQGTTAALSPSRPAAFTAAAQARTHWPQWRVLGKEHLLARSLVHMRSFTAMHPSLSPPPSRQALRGPIPWSRTPVALNIPRASGVGHVASFINRNTLVQRYEFHEILKIPMLCT